MSNASAAPFNRPIPSDWQLSTLKKVSIGGAHNGYFKKPELVGEGFKLINVSELYQPFGIDTDWSTVERVRVTPSDYRRYRVNNGDIFFTRSSLVLSGIAECNLVRIVKEPTVFECHVMRVVLDKAQVSPDFVGYCCRDAFSRSYLMARAKQTTMTTISQPEIEQLAIPVPPLPEQRKIARILTTVDNQIEKTEALIAKYQAIKQGMMHDLFTRGIDANGHLRPPHSEAPHLYKQSELGWIPKEWKVHRLGDALKECSGFLQTGPFGSQLHSYEYVDDGVPVVMPQDIVDGRCVSFNIAKISPLKARAMVRHRLQVQDAVFSRRGDLSRAASITSVEEGWICGTGCFLLRCSSKSLYSAWLVRQYRMSHVQNQVNASAVGTTMPSLNNSVMEMLWFKFPSVTEQVEIVSRISRPEKVLQNLMVERDKLRTLKAGLMQDLLTGKVRVKVDEGAEVTQ